MLLPPDLREWLDEDHLAWFVIEAIEELDLEPFYASYRADGHGRAAHDPKMMVTLLTYAYAVGERSSRGIERRCREDVAFRVICANQVPDHATVARFRVRHQVALGDLFGQVLTLCAEAGLVEVGVIAVDGSKFAAAASDSAIRTYEQIQPRSSKKQDTSTPPRTRSTAMLAATSSPSTWPAVRAAGPGCERRRSASTQSGPSGKIRSQGHARSGSTSAVGGWSRTGRPSTGQTATTRLTAPAE